MGILIGFACFVCVVLEDVLNDLLRGELLLVLLAQSLVEESLVLSKHSEHIFASVLARDVNCGVPRCCGGDVNLGTFAYKLPHDLNMASAHSYH